MAIQTDSDTQFNEGVDDRSRVARSRVTGAASAARSALGEAYSGARERVADAYEDARETMADAYAAAREKGTEARRLAAKGIDDNPAAAIVGGLALGAVVAALVPRGEREAKVLAPVGGKLKQAAKDAVEAAKSAGKEKIGELGLDRAKDSVRKIVSNAVEAVGSSADKSS